MFNALATLLALTLALHPVFAGVYLTSPVGTTTATGGQVLNVQWADDGKTPTVSSIGPCSIDLYTGSMNVQTKLQNLAASVDVSKASSVSATIDPSVGQSGAYYFIRVSSLSLKDTTNPNYPYEAFSARFWINSMSGTFNASVLAEISGGSSSSAVSSTAMPTSAKTSSTPASVVTHTVVPAAASTSASAKSGAMPRLAAPFGLVVGMVSVAGYFCL